MNIRRPTVEELPKLRGIHKAFQNEFKFPNLSLISSIYVIVNDKDEILGFGAIQPIFEAIVVLDQVKSVDERLLALDMLQARADFEMKSQGIDQLHVFVQNTQFGNLIKKRFGYKNTKGKSLVKVIKDV